MESQTFLGLLDKYLSGKATAEEELLLEEYYERLDEKSKATLTEEEEEAAHYAIFQQIQHHLVEHQKIIDIKSRKSPYRWIAAAVFIFTISVSAYFLLHQSNHQQLTSQNDVKPFTGRTLLHNGHGPAMVLDQQARGYINAAVVKTDNDEIAYSKGSSKKVIYDTLEVTAGGRPYHLKLSDGSEVIANVASKIRFPENFRQGSSQIEILEGEAYFKIVHNISIPVTIISKNQLIGDIGTEFNVNAYTDEPENRTTLIDGVATVNGRKLKRGLQAITAENNTTIATASLLYVTAWKDGYFRFNGDRIDAIMRQLSRWYNIEVRYEGKVTNEVFYGRVDRKRNISDVLSILERSRKVHFNIEGRRVTVSSKF